VSLATTIGAGALLGTVLAVGVYNVVAPSDAVPASVEVAPTYAPVPTPTVTEEAEDCVDPAVLEDDECVVHKPGPTVTLAPAPAPATTTHRESGTKGTSDSHEYGDDDSQGEEYGDDSQGEDESEHEGDHEDGDHEYGDHEDDHEDDGDEHDD
jgi:hypothetical protein